MEENIYRNSKNIPLQYLGRKGRKYYHLAPGGLNCWPALYWYVLSVWWARIGYMGYNFISSVRNGLIFRISG